MKFHFSLQSLHLLLLLWTLQTPSIRSFSLLSSQKNPIFRVRSGSQEDPVYSNNHFSTTDNTSLSASSSSSSNSLEDSAAIEDSNTIVTTPSTDTTSKTLKKPGFVRSSLLPFIPWEKIPNYLTYLRCLAIPLVIFLYYGKEYNNVLISVLFAGASFTDWLDGYLARRWQVTSSFGAFLDPVADKLMVSTALILLSGTYGASVAIPSSIILAREIGVSALREWMAQRGQRDSVKVGFQGKVKTALTMVALTLLLLVPHDTSTKLFEILYQPSLKMLYACALVTVTSGSVYFRAAWPVLTGTDSNN